MVLVDGDGAAAADDDDATATAAGYRVFFVSTSASTLALAGRKWTVASCGGSTRDAGARRKKVGPPQNRLRSNSNQYIGRK